MRDIGILTFYPSEVAKLIGKHYFVNKDKALGEFLSRQRWCDEILQEILVASKSREQVIESLPETIKKQISLTVEKTTTASNDEIIKQINEFNNISNKLFIEDAVKKLEVSEAIILSTTIDEIFAIIPKQIISAKASKKIKILQTDHYISIPNKIVKLKEIIQEDIRIQNPIIEVAIKKITRKIKIGVDKEQAIIEEISDPIIKNAIQDTPEVKLSTESIQIKRGVAMEQSILNTSEQIFKQPNIDRNTKLVCMIEDAEYPFILFGRIDAKNMDGTINEVKTRKSDKKQSVPNYDIIQLRCYMRMNNKSNGDITEHFPNTTIRRTQYIWDDYEWEIIQNSLIELIQRIEQLSDIEIIQLVKNSRF